MIVNIGSGVSIIEAEGDGFRRLTGTSLGGGTFSALSRLVLGSNYPFNDLEHWCNNGDNKGVDLLVEDIYGGDYDQGGLAGYVVASSLAKLNGTLDDISDNGTNLSLKTQCDIVKSLLYLTVDNIAHIAYLASQGTDKDSAKNKSEVDKTSKISEASKISETSKSNKYVIYTGSFTTLGPVLWKKLSYSTEFWFGANTKAVFMRHEGFLGALGCICTG